MLRLHDLLGEYEDRLRDDWARSLAPCADASCAGGADGVLSSFLGELGVALRAAVAQGAPPPLVQEPEPEEGELHASGLEAVEVTKAFGTLQGRILEIAASRGVDLTLAEQLALASRVNAAIGRAASRQVRKHDRDLHRFAHELRNPLGSARMAVSLLRSRVELGDSERLVEMLERNLLRVQGLIDDEVGDGGGKVT